MPARGQNPTVDDESDRAVWSEVSELRGPFGRIRAPGHPQAVQQQAEQPPDLGTVAAVSSRERHSD